MTAQKELKSESILDIRDLEMRFPAPGVTGLTRSSKDFAALDRINLNIKRGETLGLVGESGCGKTTLARCILQLYRPTAGSVVFDGEDLLDVSSKELRRIRKNLQIVFQDPYSSLDPRMTAGKLVAEPLHIHGLLKKGREADERVAELFRRVGLDPSTMNRYPFEFSGGQRQRLGIARALALNPKFIVCDEPVSALDASVQAQILNLLMELQDEYGLTYLFISHDLSVVAHVADRIAVMYLGKIVEISEKDQLYSNPLHPYTQALISAVPIPDPTTESTREVRFLRGEIPSPINRPSGCSFHSRCPIMADHCRGTMPRLEQKAPNHYAACLEISTDLPDDGS